MNTNDFIKCKIGDKLWSIQLGDCIVSELTRSEICVISDNGNSACYYFDGKFVPSDKYQSLFFSNPNIIAPPEPPRLPDYKPGQWIAVFDGHTIPHNIEVVTFHGWYFDAPMIKNGNGGGVATHSKRTHYCTLEELPAVLAKMGEVK